MAIEESACPLTKGERILIAVDGSKYSDGVVDQAISLGKTCNSSVFAISVIDLYPEQLAVAPALEEKMAKETREVLERVEDRVESLLQRP